MEVKQKAARLAQLRRIRREVDLLSQWIAELELAANGGDRVTGLPGRPPEGASAQLNRLWRQLERRRRRCLQLLGAMYTFIDDTMIVATKRCRRRHES